MGQVLYRKYRSKTLDEVVGQEHITETLKKALKASKISHAYLFTGPRGVGKTSVARILAHEINNSPYTSETGDIDIIEIDAASNRRIDEIRELRDKVYVAPTSSKYKVYIIDEVHMLTTPAFNALLKTLEEPPEHVIFILATTDTHKLPETIISRTQRFNFRPVPKDKVVEHLRYIASQENIHISDEALELIAEHGEGSFRDSIGMLDQAQSVSGKVELTDIQNILGIPSAEAVQNIINSIDSNQSSGFLELLRDQYDQGFQPSAVANEIAKVIRIRIVNNESANRNKDLELLKQLIEVPVAYKPAQFLEIALLSFQPDNTISHKPTMTAVISKYEVQPKANKEADIKSKAQEPLPQPTKKTAIRVDLSPDNWNMILRELKQRHNTLYGVVRMAQPKFEADKVILAFEFAFHEKKINQTSNRTVISEVIENVTGQKYEVECILDKAAVPPKINISEQSVEKDKPAPNISNITNIFEGAELLES